MAKTSRLDGRKPDQLRKVEIIPGYLRNPAGSVLVSFGDTRVICSAMVAEEVPPWMRVQKVPGGWLTAEYQMLPSSTPDRTRRERDKGAGGRTHEIQRLIGRSLRACCDLKKLGARTIHIDCDVIDADGGTRCASITGGMVALRLAVDKLTRSGLLTENPIHCGLAAVSAGIIGGAPMLDLCYAEDVDADVDMNVVMTDKGQFVEVQGTAEGEPFDRKALDAVLDLAVAGIKKLFTIQKKAVEGHTQS